MSFRATAYALQQPQDAQQKLVIGEVAGCGGVTLCCGMWQNLGLCREDEAGVTAISAALLIQVLAHNAAGHASFFSLR